MFAMTVQQLADVVGGALVRSSDPQTPVGPEVVIDSRTATPGAVFVALPGDRVDGHDYVAAAAEGGAAVALVGREVDAHVPQVVVPDVLAALAALARWAVDRGRAEGLTVVGVTGSSGKTSTKDLIAQVLGAAGATIAPPGSFNNEIGAPLTACRVQPGTRFLVAEMGARGVGHIAALCATTPPTIGAVLNVGQAHLGEFGSVEGIAVAKGELVEALEQDGWAVLNADDPRVIAMALRTRARVAAFSTRGDPAETDADLRVWASDIEPDDLQRHAFTLNVAGAAQGSAHVQLGVLGQHQVSNALAAAAVGVAAGLSLETIAEALSSARALSRWRMELTTGPDGPAVLNDAYNANPDSMRAALGSLAGLRRPGGRLIAVLGDMLELGEGSVEAHRDLGRLAADLGVDEVFATGDLGQHIASGVAEAGGRGHYVGDRAALTDQVRAVAGPADVVLVKASRGLALESVAQALAADVEGADR